MKKQNTYNHADITDNGVNKHLSGLHNSTVRVNQYVWDIMKILEKEEMFGFHFETKVGGKKILVTLHHEDKDRLKAAQKLLISVEKRPDVLFLTKVKEKQAMDKRWLIFYFLVVVAFVVTLALNFLYKHAYLDSVMETSKVEEKSHMVASDKKEPIVQEIEVDIEKLKALKESFEEQNSTTLSPKAMKALSMTTEIISEVVSEEEKAKYSSEALVKSFKGKSGFKLVVKEDNNSEDFNQSVAELNEYAMHFVKENNLSEALKYYDKVSKEDNTSKKEKLIASFHQGEIFEEIGLNEEAKTAYENSLKLSGELKGKEHTIGTLNELVNLTHLAKVDKKLDEVVLSENHLKRAKEIYDLLILELKKFGELKESELALALNYLANFYDQKDQDLLAIDMRKEAIKIYDKLLEKEHKRFALPYYKTVNSLGHSYLKIEHFPFATREYERALHFMKESVAKKVVKNRAFKAYSYTLLGEVNLLAKKLKESDKYYHKALNIYRLLVKKEESYRLELIQMHGFFAELYRAEKKFDLASEAYEKGIEGFTKMNEEGGSKYNLEIANLLNEFAIMKISQPLFEGEVVIEAKEKLQKAKQLASKVLKNHFK